MRRSKRSILAAVLATCAVTGASTPATTGSPRGAGSSAEHRVPPEEDQNPCQTQLVSDLQECEELFGGPFKPDILLETCSRGAYASYQACMAPKQPA